MAVVRHTCLESLSVKLHQTKKSFILSKKKTKQNKKSEGRKYVLFKGDRICLCDEIRSKKKTVGFDLWTWEREKH